MQCPCKRCLPTPQHISRTHQVKRSRSKDAILTLKGITAASPASERRSLKRTEGDASLSPPNDRSKTQPTLSERVRECHVVSSLSDPSITQPRVVLGTPLSLTQQSSGLFRALAPSPRVQERTHPIVPVTEPATTRNEAARVNHAYLADKYHKGGKHSQDSCSTAEARAKRAGEAVSLTPTVSQLSISWGAEPAGEGTHPFAVTCGSSSGLTNKI